MCECNDVLWNLQNMLCIHLFTGVLILLIFMLQKFGNGTFGLERLNYQWVALLKQQFNKFLKENIDFIEKNK